MHKKTNARLMAVQALYSIDLLDDKEQSEQEMLEHMITLQSNSQHPPMQYNKKLFSLLFAKVKQEKSILDNIIIQYLDKSWPIERMDCTLLSIIRAATCELTHSAEVDTNVVLNEYVTIATMFLQPEEVNFINAILVNIAKHIRGPPVESIKKPHVFTLQEEGEL